jgi:hypothetical protein
VRQLEYKLSAPDTFANPLREFDSARDFIMSAALSAIRSEGCHGG